MITSIRASTNNRASTVLDLFLHAAATYGVPSRIRGDHGGENVLVASFMETVYGAGRGSYLWGRFVFHLVDCQSITLPSFSGVFTTHVLSAYG